MAQADPTRERKTTAAEIEKVSDKLFTRVWEFVKACDEREKHFNDLQNRYRALALTWFLATFGGIGFTLSTKFEMMVSREAMITGLAIAGAIGITLLWVVDILIYHDLLISGFTAGRQLEQAFKWLPPIRSYFGKPRPRLRVRTQVAIFYIAGVEVLCIGAAAILCLYGLVDKRWSALPLGVGIGLAAVIVLLTQRALRWTDTLPTWIEGD